ncbi:hypothetical protein [Salinisphaera sp. LB1]|uniref:hypothetical protein n=1 Tax=Salinisphaera sp. LB1 TaxID=2183911 RepID=UPI000D7D8BDD|nr:hypothetical protein [Salinisphaera sp. LB1]AWN15524.1 hypothetical protein SALB1_1321 [Salinisphaera sp. LB1]
MSHGCRPLPVDGKTGYTLCTEQVLTPFNTGQASMGSKQKSQQKLPRQRLKSIKDTARGKTGGPNRANRQFKGYR